jgi:imidazolonepropionase
MALSFELLLTNVHLATMSGALPYGIVRDGAIGVVGDRIAWCGPMSTLPAGTRAALHLDRPARWATPGLIDCHTHLVHGGNRYAEFEARLQGASYADVARAGGGINATVRATRAASEDELVASGRGRLAALAEEGVTTIEIKSGYGLEAAAELKQLAAARRLGRESGVDVRTTLLAAHALPPEYEGRRAEYIDVVCATIIPEAARAGLADAVDAFCEGIGFTPEETRRVFAAARSAGLPVKLHADQLSNLGGAALAAKFCALSADHLEHTDDAGVAAMARAGTVAVLLPGAFYALRETRRPPVAQFRVRQVPMAVATDCNPGTSPVTSLLLMLNMACTLFGLTPEEALAGVTRCAARALGLDDRGVLAPGLRADIALWDIEGPGELAYRIGANPSVGAVRGGRFLPRRQR